MCLEMENCQYFSFYCFALILPLMYGNTINQIIIKIKQYNKKLIQWSCNGRRLLSLLFGVDFGVFIHCFGGASSSLFGGDEFEDFFQAF